MQMAIKSLKRYSSPLISKKVQIKTAMKYHFTPIGIAVIFKNQTDWKQKNGNPCMLLVDIYKNGTPTGRTVRKFFKNSK